MNDATPNRARPEPSDRKETEDGLDTRERLILAAEKLFAEEGMGVSMRRINAAAGQKNVSAMHYHFGNRDALIEAIFDYRMGAAAERREALLRHFAEEGREGDLRAMVKVAIWPLVEQIGTAARGNHFVRFLSQAHRIPEFDDWNSVRHRSRRSLAQAYVRILRLVDDVPRPVVHMRAVMGLRRAIYMLADLDRVIDARHPGMRDQMLAFYANDLIDMLVTDLRAPLSPATRAGYEALINGGSAGRAGFFGADALQAIRLRPQDRSAD